MKKFGHFILLFCLSFIGYNLQAQDLELTQFATGLNSPVDLQNAGDTRLFAVEKDGIIRIINTGGTVESTPFLDITDRVVNNAGERGLLGLAFHPQYASNGFFFVSYTTDDGTSTVSRFTVTADANTADPDSELVLLIVEQPFSNHNGGCIQFGADDYLYISFGDGGSGGDPQNNSQNTQTFLGKILRVDVDNGNPYAVPTDNPFVDNPDVLDEIWSIGLRNPWRFSFDRQTGNMWIGDVGQNSFEEIDFEPAGLGGRNYGWRCYEGFSEYNLDGCGSAGEYTDPIHTYPTINSVGKSVTGGYVYQGTENPDLVGHYLYGDFVSGRIWSLFPNLIGGFDNTELLNWTDNNLSAFGEDTDGEMYIVALQEGNIYKIGTACVDFQVDAIATDVSCNSDNDGSISVTPPDANATILFGNGAVDFDLNGLAAGDYEATVTDENGCTTTLSTTIEEPAAIDFDLEGDIVSGDVLAPLGFASYEWYVNGILFPDEIGSSISSNTSDMGGFYVIVTDNNGCTFTSEELFFVQTTNQIEGLQEFEIAPNPFVNQINIRLSTEKAMELNLQILTLDGKVLQEENISVFNDFSKIMNLEDLARGVYLLKLTTGNSAALQRIVKQ